MAMWVNLEGTVLNKLSQRKTNTTVSLICRLLKSNQTKIRCTEPEDKQKTAREERVGNKIGEGGEDVQTSIHVLNKSWGYTA